MELGGRLTPADAEGLLITPLPVSELLEGAVVPDADRAAGPGWAYYDRLIEDAMLGRNRRHELTYAY
ncbi:MAG: hypothetical protein R3D98_01090 [Candidatus Krumholzibacteriia bacterium]